MTTASSTIWPCCCCSQVFCLYFWCAFSPRPQQQQQTDLCEDDRSKKAQRWGSGY
jgi:hypothetical protein